MHAPGTNRDNDLAEAVRMAGGTPVVRPLSTLREEKTNWLEFEMLALPGGFSYGDALGAGRLWALNLVSWFSDQLNEFVAQERTVIGICNGFQALVKTGVLPASDDLKVTLTSNASGKFECRWVTLKPNKENVSPWLDGLENIQCPVAHGEGRFLAYGDFFPKVQIAFSYVSLEGNAVDSKYPKNPNGSLLDIAGITNPEGNVLGLMPHPENHIHGFQNPGWTRGKINGLGLSLFENGLRMSR